MTKILIIDDSGLSRRILRKILTDASYEVIEAKDGFSALELFTLEHPDLVMLDLTMPGINGFEVMKQLKSIAPDTHIVIASADIQRFTIELSKKEGAEGFISKPFVEEEVLDIVSKLTKKGKT